MVAYHLFQRQTFRLRYEKPNEASTEEGQNTKENIGAVGDVGEHVRGNLADDEVVPVPSAWAL